MRKMIAVLVVSLLMGCAASVDLPVVTPLPTPTYENVTFSEEDRPAVEKWLANELSKKDFIGFAPKIFWTKKRLGIYPAFMAMWHNTGRVCYGWVDFMRDRFDLIECANATPMRDVAISQ